VNISGTQIKFGFVILIGLFAAVAGGTATKFYPYDSSSHTKPLRIPTWAGQSFFVAIGFVFVLLGMLGLCGYPIGSGE
jgi:hypothetical protein